MQTRPQREQQRHPTSNQRYTFDAEGSEHRAVCSNVAVGGAFFRARFVPAPEQVLTLRASPEDSGIHLVCRVVWALSTPRLDAPETGFGVAFEEAYSTRSQATFIAFMRAEFGLNDVQLTQVPRKGKAAYVYSFASVPIQRSSLSQEVVDTQQTRPKPGPDTEVTDPRLVMLSWAKGEAVGQLTHIANSMIRLVLKDAPPSLYEGVTLTPSFPSFHTPSLIMHGTVTGSARMPGDDTGKQIAIRIWEIEELDDKQTFDVYRELVEDS